jgi:hypothetical protein
MPDFTDYAVTRETPANLNVPTHRLAGKIIDGATTLADYTGDNVLTFPSVLSTLSLEHQDLIVNMVSQRIMELKAGI